MRAYDGTASDASLADSWVQCVFARHGAGSCLSTVSPGTIALDWVRQYRPDNKLTQWPQGYESQFFWFDDMPILRRSGPTIGWVNAAYRSSVQCTLNADWLRSIQLPVLAFVAGDEKIVSASATDYALPFIPHLERHDFAGARHELLHELPKVTDQLWASLLAFIEKNRVG